MRWIIPLALSCILVAPAFAEGPDDDYLSIYNEILQADSYRQSGHPNEAAVRYLEAQKALQKLKQEHPLWNAEVVAFRLDYVGEQIQSLGAPALAAATAPPPAAVPAQPQTRPQQTEIAGLRDQVNSLTAANAQLENKLKEALSIQPAAVNPAELAKAREEIVALQKEKDLLSVALDQAKSAKPSGGSDQTANQLAEANQALADLKTRSTEEAKAAQDQIAQLKESLAAAQKKVENSSPASVPAAAADTKADQLSAQLAVLQAQAVPYSADELAILNKSQSAPPATLPAPPPEHKHVVHSMKDLPPGAGALMTAATRAAMARDFATAAARYEQILQQDENNVYVLAHLGNAQYAMGQPDACEKTVQRALALDPEDPACLYLLGVLRFHQDKIDEAFNYLSMSAKYNPTNASTQFELGRVLADKGMRPAAETAFRKALQAEPDYADAHFGLALVYAKETPPSLALARWHYQRATDLGHPKSEELEKMLSAAP